MHSGHATFLVPRRKVKIATTKDLWNKIQSLRRQSFLHVAFPKDAPEDNALLSQLFKKFDTKLDLQHIKVAVRELSLWHTYRFTKSIYAY